MDSIFRPLPDRKRGVLFFEVFNVVEAQQVIILQSMDLAALGFQRVVEHIHIISHVQNQHW